MSKIYEESEIEEIIDSFENMEAEEFDNANPELKTIYIEYGLEERRQRHFAKFR